MLSTELESNGYVQQPANPDKMYARGKVNDAFTERLPRARGQSRLGKALQLRQLWTQYKGVGRGIKPLLHINRIRYFIIGKSASEPNRNTGEIQRWESVIGPW
jgi:hypothetical protein